jgi:hypothetical protein
MALGKPYSTINVTLSESAWTELLAALPPAFRSILYVEGEPAIPVGMSGHGIRIIREKKGDKKMNQDFEDQKLATVSAGFDSVEDEQSWLQYLDGLAATHEAEMLERLAADSAYEERRLGKMMKGDF